ncbi:MAG: zinc-binding dehydrogenase [Desulfobacterales bacterium]
MKTAVLSEPRKFDIAHLPIPEPRENEVRVKIEGCGICGSDLPVWSGSPWFDYPAQPGAPGHEAWGRIDKVGAGVRDFDPGARVAFLSYHGYSEFDIAAAEQVVNLPEFLDDKPFPAEPLACAMNIINRSRITEGQTVAVLGIGFQGALLTKLAENAGARVIAVSRRPFALDIAMRNGAWKTIRMDGGTDVIDTVAKFTENRFCDTVIEAAGKQNTLDLAGEITTVRGRLVIAGFHQEGLRTVNMQLWNWKGLDVINAHERDPMIYVDGIRTAIEAVSTGRLSPDTLFTHTFRLDRLDDAFYMLERRPDNFLKALALP